MCGSWHVQSLGGLCKMGSGVAQTAVHNASFIHGEAMACHFDGIVRLLCVNDQLRQHVKAANNSTTLAARQAAIAAATALAE